MGEPMRLTAIRAKDGNYVPPAGGNSSIFETIVDKTGNSHCRAVILPAIQQLPDSGFVLRTQPMQEQDFSFDVCVCFI